MTVGILYIDRFCEGEEFLLGSWPAVRVQSASEISAQTLLGAKRWVLRAKRLTLPEYCSISGAVEACGCSLVNSNLSYALISSLRAVQDALSDFGPPMVAGRRDQSAAEFIAMADSAGLRAPLFVRSEVESAAKYAGREACTVASLAEGDAEVPLRSLARYVSGFNEIAMKEIWAIKKLGTTDIDLEYRSVGYRGKLVTVDLRRGNLIPPLEPWHIDFLNGAYKAIARLGADGAHVIDLAIRASNRKPFVVEWKDLSSSSLKNPEESLGATLSAIEVVDAQQ